MSSEKLQNVQDVFLNYIRKQKTPVTIFLVNGVKLQGVLTFHVVPGRLSAADLRDGQTLTTVNGETLMVTKANGQVMVGNANGMATVTQANVYASNGVAHVIDAVLLP
mgnify:CR=1 FL=1